MGIMGNRFVSVLSFVVTILIFQAGFAVNTEAEKGGSAINEVLPGENSLFE